MPELALKKDTPWKLDPGATSAAMGTAVVALWGWLNSRIQGWQSEKPL